MNWILLRFTLFTVAACLALGQANADILRTLTVRTVVTAVASDSITVQGRPVQGDSVHTFPVSLLGVSVDTGDSVVIEVVIGKEFGRWNGRILEAWEISSEERITLTVVDTISADRFVYSKAAGQPVEIAIAVGDSTGAEYLVPVTRNQLKGYAPGDTAQVSVHFHSLERKTGGETETRPDLGRYRAQLVSIKKRE